MKKPECSSCPHTHKCSDVWSKENAGPLTAGGLVITSAIAFLMPLALAIIAGAIGDASGQGQGMVMLLSLAGLVVGGGLAAVLVKILKKRYSRSDDLCQYGPVLSEDMDT